MRPSTCTSWPRTSATAASACFWASLTAWVIFLLSAISVLLLVELGGSGGAARRTTAQGCRCSRRGGCRRCGCGRGGPALADERQVDVDEHRALPVGQDRVGGDGGEDVRGGGRIAVGDPLVEDAGPDVERLGRDLQPLGDLLQDLGAGALEPALDLRQVGVGDSGHLGKLPQRQLGALALLAQVGPEVGERKLAHASIVLTGASKMQTLGSVSPPTPPASGSLSGSCGP